MPEFIVFLFGLLVGSFLNLCIYRLPLNESIIHPSSNCDQCHTKLQVRDLIPVVSFLFLRGHCRHCGGGLPHRYPVIELVTGFVFLWSYFVWGLTPQLAVGLVFASFMIVITVIDYDHRLIFDKVLVRLAGSGVAINLLIGNVSLWDMIGGFFAGGGILFALAFGSMVLAGQEGMGMGDVKFMAVLGLWLGIKLILLTITLSFLLGGFGGMLLLALKIKGRKDVIPFGPSIAAAAWIALLYGKEIIAWYSRQL